jgi:hypothetical protein
MNTAAPRTTVEAYLSRMALPDAAVEVSHV